ncbi:G-D-S-L family lipolytic protein [Sphingobacterium oryzagri]|uniref:G-D-S-L family lipolytic protein n=1 Tax=Sphingobacterium oryzagri TaxID=3025669 RepID=A0ABY7WHB9_9SPHI|nr:SGNH/GDSL hydrolase family protein [Sphingobacterium sp. KACC 22765]WDF69019.1 G-D-S-L family lipolytic protein [Sphingobacterium sp. KACC 22765]
MKRAFNYTWFYVGLASLTLAASCKPEIDGFVPTAGQANFSKYISVGNSLTAGFADGGLYLAGQQVAYPNLIAEQLQQVGGGEFRSPLFSEAQRNGSGYLELAALVNGQPQTRNVTENLGYRAQGRLVKYTEEIENLGVPGMRIDLASVPQFSSLNMYFERLLPDNEVNRRTYKDFATTKNHTFFSFWLGNNDVLGYAMNGAYQNPLDPTTTLTSVAVFNGLYNEFIDLLTANQQKGVVATIPTVTSIPFFTTVTTARLVAGVSASTNGAYSNIYIRTAAGVRTATSDDLFTLRFPTDTLGKTSGGIPGYGLIPQNPLSDQLVIDRDEVVEIAQRVTAFNDIIKAAASRKGLAVADAQAYLNRVSNPGIMYNGVNVNASFITGNAFSLDGIHLTPMGNALIANLFIDAINAQYGSKIPKVDATRYPGVKFP